MVSGWLCTALLVLGAFHWSRATHCLNGGFAQSEHGQCVCPRNTFGSWCQFRCGRGTPMRGSFRDLSGYYYYLSHCECDRGFFGVFCDANAPPAEDDSRLHACSGRGSWDLLQNRCHCQSGNFGRFCQFSCGKGAPFLLANPNPYDPFRFSDIYCYCPTGHTGYNCEIEDPNNLIPTRQPVPPKLTTTPATPASAESEKHSSESAKDVSAEAETINMEQSPVVTIPTELDKFPKEPEFLSNIDVKVKNAEASSENSEISSKKGSNSSDSYIIIGIIGAVIVFLILVGVIAYSCCRRGRKESEEAAEPTVVYITKTDSPEIGCRKKESLEDVERWIATEHEKDLPPPPYRKDHDVDRNSI